MLRITKAVETGLEGEVEVCVSANASHADLLTAAAEYMADALAKLADAQTDDPIDIPEGAVLGHGFVLPPAEGYDQSIVYRFVGAISEYARSHDYMVLSVASDGSTDAPVTVIIARRADVESVDDAYVIGQYTDGLH